MVEQHTLRTFDTGLRLIASTISEMGRLVEKQVGDSVHSLTSQDAARAEAVVRMDAEIDRLQFEIERRVVAVIAKHQPVASDLRQLIGALRLSNDLERVGDLAKNVGKRVVALKSEFPPAKMTVGIARMNELVLGQLHSVLNAYVDRSDNGAMEVWRSDREIDAFCAAVFREMLTYMMEDPRNISPCIHLLFCAKNIERIGDHATNVAETVLYIVRGTALREERPKADTTTMNLRAI